MKIRKTIIFVLIIFSLIGISWIREADFIKKIKESLTDFYEAKNPAKLHLAFNQPEYYPGDTAFFRAYLLQAKDLTPYVGKQIINVKVVGGDEKVVMHSRFIYNDGNCVGQLSFPKDFHGGYYTVVAYSDKMEESMSPDNFCYKKILIAEDKNMKIKQNDRIEIFVEGGNLVAGVSNKMVLMSHTNAAKARISNSSDQIIKEFQVNSEITTFYFTPAEHEKYVVVINDMRTDFPEVKDDGVTMIASKDNDSDYISVQLYTKELSAFRNNPLYLILNVQDKIYHSSQLLLQKDSSTITIPIRNCQEGIAQLSLLSPKTGLLSERLIFIKRSDEISAKIDLKSVEYETRKPVDVNISVKDAQGNPVKATFTMSVYKKDLFPSQSQENEFSENIFINSDVVRKKGYSSVPVDLNRIDDYLITRKWNKFILNESSSKTSKITNSMPFYFKGRALFANNKPIPDSSRITFYMNKEHFVFGAYVKKNGEFEFPLFSNFGDDELFYSIQSKDKIQEDARIILQDNLKIDGTSQETLMEESRNVYAAFSSLKNKIDDSFNYYQKRNKNEVIDAEYVNSEMLNVDFEVNMDKYSPFATMRDALNEIIPMVRYKKSEEKESVRVFVNETTTFSRQDPIYIIDDVMTDSTNYFLSLNPAQVKRIGVLQSQRNLNRFGVLGKNGVIVVETKIPDHQHLLPRTKRSTYITGISKPIKFTHNSIVGQQSKTPNLRSTLYWEGRLATDEMGNLSTSFYTNDCTGEYVIHLEGITEEGRIFSTNTSFSVIFKKEI